MGDGERILNLWEGFKPSIISVFDKTKKFEESCPILHEYFLKSLSSGSEEVYSYLLRWDTDAIVNPQRLAGRTALFLHSRKGRNGKNTKFRLMRAIIGEKHCFDTSRAKSTDGGFTEHFANQYLLCFSETFSDSKRGPFAHIAEQRRAYWFSLIDDEVAEYEPKGIGIRRAVNYRRLMITSNRRFSVPADAGSERESSLAEVSDAHYQDYQVLREDGQHFSQGG